MDARSSNTRVLVSMWIHVAVAVSSVLSVSAGTGSAPGAVSLHLDPTSSAVSTPSELSWTGVSSLLGHLNSVSHLLRDPLNTNTESEALLEDSSSSFWDNSNVRALKPSPFDMPSASLLVLLGGVTPDVVPLTVSFSIPASTASSVGNVASYLNHFTELLVSDHSAKRANLISVASVCQDSTTSIAGMSRLSLKKENAIASVPDSAPAALKSKFTAIAASAFSHPQKSFQSVFAHVDNIAVLKESNKADRAFMIEMNAIKSVFAEFKSEKAEMLNKAEPGFLSDFWTVSITRISKIHEAHGLESEQYAVATVIFQQVISEMLDAFKAIYPDGIVQVLSVAPIASSVSKRDLFQPSLERRLAKVNTACPQFFSDCMTLNNNCSNHGMCTQMPNPRASNQTCFFCSCYTNNTDDNGELIIGGSNRKVLWAGASCVQQDISSEFHLLLWSSVGLIVVLVFVIGLLASVGSEDPNSAGAGSGKSKDD
ncbi:hypothetical protein BJ741DRAFT_651597 [Chytriomyces cf. hyalinus JEL632]|nr:hypothetical protein BJ741DRAFT_651597 [Chytriomyces cf. hyalinus JEL632]